MDVRLKHAQAKEYALRLRLQKAHNTHSDFLKEHQLKNSQYDELDKHNKRLERDHQDLTHKYDSLKLEIKDEVQKFKGDAKEKLKTYKLEIRNLHRENEDLKQKNTDSDSTIKQLKERNNHILEEMKELTNKFDKSKTEFIKRLNHEKDEMREQFNLEKKRYDEEIAALKMLREPLNPRRKAN